MSLLDSATVRTVAEAFRTGAIVRAAVNIYQIVITISYKPLVEIWTNFNTGAVENKHELNRFWGQKVEGEGHIETSNKHLGRHCLTYSRNVRTYFIETYHNRGNRAFSSWNRAKIWSSDTAVSAEFQASIESSLLLTSSGARAPLNWTPCYSA